MGVVSGITMSFQFGTNWPGFMERVGNVAGPLLAYEVLTAFFLEATFLGIMLFGFRREELGAHDGDRARRLRHHHVGLLDPCAELLDAHAPPASRCVTASPTSPTGGPWCFKPSMPYRLAHMLLASGLTCAFLVAGLSAFRWLRGDRGPSVHAALRTGVTVARRC